MKVLPSESTFRRRPVERAVLSAAVLALSGPLLFPDIAAAAPIARRACQLVPEDRAAAVSEIRDISHRVIAESFPRLEGRTIEVKPFESPSTFFKTRFSISHYLTLRGTRIILSVNPCVFKLGAPPDGIEAIIAHELAHAEDYIGRGPFRRIGLVGLISAKTLARFERRTDLVAIERGYSAGLIRYRQWLYGNLTAEQAKKKRRNYFTPEEIVAIDTIMVSEPKLFRELFLDVPLSIDDLNGKAQQRSKTK